MIGFRPLLLLPVIAVAACTATAPAGGPVTSAAGSAVADEQVAALPRLPSGPLAPESLKGLAAPQLSAKLGEPSFRRRDPPAEIWQYRVPACTLDLFLYEEKGAKTVAHYAVRTPSGNTIGDRACLDEVQARKHGAPTS